MATLDDFRKNFNGIKANRFKIIGGFPPSVGINSNAANEALEIFCKATQFPGSAVGVIDLNYRGRKVKFPAERAFADWPIQIYSSSIGAKDLRSMFAKWKDYINDPNHTSMNYKAYAGEWQILYNDMNFKQSTVLYYNLCTLVNVFPIEVTPIELSNDTTDVFAEFTVTLSFDYAIFSV